jgi:hypothetical protein
MRMVSSAARPRRGIANVAMPADIPMTAVRRDIPARRSLVS